ncbi:DUF4468 domain-containing protein [Dysgonomonas sp. ZJ279]|uniref:DUF4468 domain-containing protein n=1 Tax=Dysgonomonas sp. ZJ279 TaxID=2709796 RepID=UPI0013EDC036|nr:DUF4468 domain-containing protein [Dysgonomonas sp. ZJ279]
MNRYLLTIVCFMFCSMSFAQVVKQGEKFMEVSEVEGKVVFLKEIQLKEGTSERDNYQILREWAKVNYDKDPFRSSVRYDNRNREIIAKSRVELVLPIDTKGVREKMIMRYRINAFLFQGKCVLEVTDIIYLYENTKSDKQPFPRLIRAEDFITDKQLEEIGGHLEFKQNTRKSTFYFLNELSQDLESKFGY